ncbi:MAG: EF-hand domain-containing protein [Planctomycetota bacterium]
MISAADFEESGGLGGRMGRQRQRMREMYRDSKRMTPRILHRYFQTDHEGQEEGLTRAALSTAFEAYDRDGNGAIDREEFKEESEQRAARPIPGIGEYDRFRHLLAEIDGSGDGILDLGELHAYFKQQDEDGDGALTFGETGRRGAGMRGRGGGGGGGRGGGSAGGWPGPAAGEIAPDFTLEPHDGR